jgi:hypothetical protein
MDRNDVSSGQARPWQRGAGRTTLTIVALAVRPADYIAQQMASNTI